ncbi:MAG: mannose-1-phosphate guanylyltransferase/mannose-6-phosphate isomerase [Desulfobacterales bacterium]
MHDTKLFSVLLAGGAGTRLWPVSRQLYPKQLARFIGNDSLIQSTIHRMTPFVLPDNIRIVCGLEHFYEIGRHMKDAGIPPEGKILSEPCGRNTAPAILLALFHISQLEPDAVVCVFPADHVIKNIQLFQEKVLFAADLAREGHIVTFGIMPHYPETGYGYIEGAEPISNGALRVKRFVEKPNKSMAENYVASGNFFWNSGMFVFSTSVMIAEFERHGPELVSKMADMLAGQVVPDLEAYEQMPNISIDYAVMEKTDKAVVLPVDFGWSDIGSWKSLFDFMPKDADNNVIVGDVMTHDAQGCLILGRDRLIAVNLLKNAVVVDTPDSVFISDIENSRDVKCIVDRLKLEGRKECYQHRTMYHPWGTDTLLEDAGVFTVDRLTIFPRQSVTFSPGTGAIRHVIVAAGAIIVSAGDESRTVAKGETFVFGMDETTLYNPDDQPAEIVRITIQCPSGQ